MAPSGPGLIHISELANYRVEEVSEIVKLGDEVDVKVIGVDSRKRQIKLSIKAIEVHEPIEEETDETPLTAMQIALQRAMGDSGTDAAHTFEPALEEPRPPAARPGRHPEPHADDQAQIGTDALG